MMLRYFCTPRDAFGHEGTLSQFEMAVAVCREGPGPDRSWRATARRRRPMRAGCAITLNRCRDLPWPLLATWNAS